MTTIVWFQRDLRVSCNPALNLALQGDAPIVAVYVHSPQEDSPWQPGAASRWWLHHSLQALAKELERLGIRLQFFKANSLDLIPRIAADCDASSVLWTERHEPFRRDCESVLETELKSHGIEVVRFRDELLTNPDQFLTTGKSSPYRVFTPFYKRLRKQLQFETLLTSERRASKQKPAPHSEALTLHQLGLLDPFPWHEKLHRHWVPGEQSALLRLHDFVENHLGNYPEERDFPSSAGTSSLSPHLHFGEISPRQILNALQPHIQLNINGFSKAAESWLRQLIWREFSRYILRHFPATPAQPMDRRFEPHFWENDELSLGKWQRGETGIPIVDAGMRQLWETGWMHNRVRMLTASLLTKNLGIEWQAGARWFWETLVDADLANNTMGWQWVAGCGVDAAPYFRLFNPLVQAKRFDPDQVYSRRWIPTIEDETYPEPIIDLAASRNLAMERYKHKIQYRRR